MKFDVQGSRSFLYTAASVFSGDDFFCRRRLFTLLVIAGTAALYAVSSSITEFTHLRTVTGIPAGIFWLIRHFYPSHKALSVLPVVLITLLKTAVFAVTATMTAAAFSLFFAFLGSHRTGRLPFFRLVIAILAAFFRNVPLPAWTIVLLLSFRQSEITGFLALFFITGGHLTRAFTEIIDEQHDDSAAIALEAAGTAHVSIIIHGILPDTAPLLMSWILYAVETNIRDSALVGILTGTGVGLLFNLYFKSFRYNETGLVICILMITVLSIDVFSNWVRRILL